LLGKMPGDQWQRFANLRMLYGYQFGQSGKKLLFMGAELAPWGEWNHDVSLEWNVIGEDPGRAAHLRYLSRLGELYHDRPSLWITDESSEGFA